MTAHVLPRGASRPSPQGRGADGPGDLALERHEQQDQRRIASVVAAITSVQLFEYWLCRLAVATVTGAQVGPEVITSGHMNEFQWVTTVMSTRVTMIGRFSGTTSDHSRRGVPAPSIRIASTSSVGIERKFSRGRKIAYGDPSTKGITSAQKVLRRSAAESIRYSGTTTTTWGTMSVATYTQNSRSRPGKRRSAKA